MKTMRIPAAPMAGPEPVPSVAPVQRTRRPPPPQPRPDTGGPGTVNTGRGAVAQKPHNPDNHVSAMPTATAKGAPVKGYRNGGMVKGKC